MPRSQMVANDYRIGAYDQAWNELLAADEQLATLGVGAARQHLDRAEQLSLPPGVADLFYYMLASRWYQIDAYEQCLETCRRVQDPDRMPGVYSLRAFSLQSQGDNAAALVAADDYERVLGFQPDMVRLRAQLLDDLERADEALACWRSLAAFAPDNSGDVYALCKALPEGQRTEVLDLVRRAEDPLTVAADVIRASIYNEDDATRDLLQQFVEETAPESPLRLELQGHALDYQGEYEAAAECFRQAAESSEDAERRDAYWVEFLASMTEAGEPVAGYRAMPDKRDAFQTLIGGIEYDEAMIDQRDLPELLDVHRQRFPEDPWTRLGAGWLAARQDDLDQADREFAAAEAAGDPAVSELAGSERRSVLHRQGRLREAYEAYAEDANVFQELAANCRYRAEPDGLRMLLEMQRTRHPEDPWIPFYSAVLSQLEDDPQAALDLLDAVPVSEDSGTAYQVRWMRQQLQVELGQWKDAYESSEQPRVAFAWIIGQLTEQQDADAFRDLVQLHRARDPGDPESLLQSVAWAAEHDQDAEVAKMLDPWPAELDVADYQRTRLRQQLVGALLRLGRISRAEELAREFADDEDDPQPLLQVLIHQRDWPSLEVLLDDPQVISAIQYGAGYGADWSLQAYRSDPAARPFRERVPPPLPSTQAGVRIALLRNASPDLSAEGLQPLLDDGAEWRELPSEVSQGVTAFEVRDAGHTVLISAGAGGYCDADDVWEWGAADAELRAIGERCKGWIEIQVLETDDPVERKSDESLAQCWAAKLFDDTTTAVSFWNKGDFGRVARVDEATDERLRDAKKLEEVFPEAAELYLGPRYAAEVLDQKEWSGQRRRDLRAFCRRAITEAKDQTHLVRLLTRYGGGTESLWVRVTGSEHTGYGEFALQGTLQSDSGFWPYLKQGEPIRFYSSEVLEWKPSPADDAANGEG